MSNRVTATERLVAVMVLIASVTLGVIGLSLFQPATPEYTDHDQPIGGPDFPLPASRAIGYWVVT